MSITPRSSARAALGTWVVVVLAACNSRAVELYKRTEAQNGVTQFFGYDFHGGTLLPPPTRLQRKLEIIGDSDVAGFGYQGSITGSCLPGPVWSAHLENFRQAWGERLATSLHAELNATVFSGKGLYFNIWRPDTETIGVLYPRSNPVEGTSVFDFTKFTPDVVVVSLWAATTTTSVNRRTSAQRRSPASQRRHASSR